MSTETAVKAGLVCFHAWVGGREVEGRAGSRPATNPANGEAFARVSLLDAAQAAEAVGAAEAAFPAWSRTSFRERTRLLDRLRQAIVDEADEIARLIEREQGKPFAEALAAEILPSLDALQHLSAHAEDLLRDDAVEAEQILLAHKRAGSSTPRSAWSSRSSRGTTRGRSRSPWLREHSWPGTPSCSSPPRPRLSSGSGSGRSRVRPASPTGS
jgi:hypothetical protein